MNARVHRACRLGMEAGRGSRHHRTTTAASAAVLCRISAISESQLLRKPICLVKVNATRNNRAQYDERNRLEFCDKTEWKQKGQNSETRKEKKSIDRKRMFAGKVEGIYNQDKVGSFKEEGKKSVRNGGRLEAVRRLMVKWEDEWEEKE